MFSHSPYNSEKGELYGQSIAQQRERPVGLTLSALTVKTASQGLFICTGSENGEPVHSCTLTAKQSFDGCEELVNHNQTFKYTKALSITSIGTLQQRREHQVVATTVVFTVVSDGCEER